MALFGLKLKQNAMRAIYPGSELLLRPALCSALTFQPFSEGYISQDLHFCHRYL